MLVSASRLIGTPVLSVRAGGAVSRVAEAIVDPDQLKIIAFRLAGGIVTRRSPDLLDTTSIREYSHFGMVIDDIDELVTASDVVRIGKVLELNFSLPGLQVETKKGTRLGRVSDYIVHSDNFLVQQIIVERPVFKRLFSPELTIPRKEIIEVTDTKVIIKDEEKKLKEQASKEEFVPNFVNPFRNPESGFAPTDTKTPADKDTE